MEPNDEGIQKPGRMPVEEKKTMRIIDREEQVETVTDPFGQEMTRRIIKQRIIEVQADRTAAPEDLPSLPDLEIDTDLPELNKQNT